MKQKVVRPPRVQSGIDCKTPASFATTPVPMGDG